MASSVKYDLMLLSKIFIISIGSGKDEKRVKALAALLSTQSFYFHRACTEPWLGPNKILEFPHESSETFEVFLVWLNKYDIRYASSLKKIESRDNDQTRSQELSKRWSHLLNCYIMADYIQAPKYANVIMDALVETLKDFEEESTENNELLPMCDTCAETITLIWDKTLNKSPLRKLVIDFLFSTRHAPWSRTQKMFSDLATPPDGPNLTVPQEFMLEFVEQSFRKLQCNEEAICPWSRKDNSYHISEKLPGDRQQNCTLEANDIRRSGYERFGCSINKYYTIKHMKVLHHRVKKMASGGLQTLFRDILVMGETVISGSSTSDLDIEGGQLHVADESA